LTPPESMDRLRMLDRLASENFDVLVIGGGITGAGVALDASSRGLKTALVERSDFASGTSSKSSKMVHGGIRYLQQHDFRLVYEALHERQRLLDNAPHLVSPLPFLIPLLGRGGVVDRSVARTYSTALWIYDLTGGLRIGKRHRRISREELLRHLPTFRADRLVAGFLYYDARADDARLTLAILRTAALDFDAALANYAEVTGLLHDSAGQVRGALVKAAISKGISKGKEWRPRTPKPSLSDVERPPAARAGAPEEPEEMETAGGGVIEIEVRASAVVNATGVWADDIRALDEGRHPRSLRPAKGIHLSVPSSKLPADAAAVVPVRRDRRSIFIVPWPGNTHVYIGTTDTDWEGSLDDPACSPDDVDYLVEATNAVLTDPISREDVTGAWAGLRPLLARSSKGGEPSARTADLSRRHSVRVSEGGLVSVTGGKLTTYRLMAEDAVDAAVDRLPPGKRDERQRCLTRRLAIRGGADRERLDHLRCLATAAEYGLEAATFQMLVGRYGTEVGDVLARAGGDRGLLEPLVEGLPHLKVEALWAIEHEMAESIDDIFSRRTRASLQDASASSRAALDPLVQAMLAEAWGRPVEDVADEATAWASRLASSMTRAGLEKATP